MYKDFKEPNGSFFISGKSERESRNFGLNQSRHELLSFADMSPFYLAWKRMTDKTFDDIQKLTPSKREKLKIALEGFRAFIPPEFVRSRKRLKVLMFLSDLNTGFKKNFPNLLKKAEELRVALKEEENEAMFLCLSETERDHYRDKEQFGQIAPVKFKEIAGDIDEAYKCLAVGRYTASVFHCMRMLEYGVHKLASHFDVDLQVDVIDGRTGKRTRDKRDQEWNALCQQILREIKHLPAPTPTEQETKLKFEDLAIHLSNVRAERNAVMHARYATTKRFTAKKAENVLEETKSFIAELALVLP